ncbi:hypothetical protein NW755_013657 [Fusarium falciforme]|uniref:Transcription factor domain-containing protein n=1 Tax=Fusarium falciforme TaxID=195108 RepID=A0A9W8UVE6_9HYPO|nr:hypothetical protein NW755_013657 [Fusarium falciforme]
MDAEDETEVPREARLVCDAQGKLIFVGDCAPLSFFQSVRQLVTTRVGQNAFAPQTSRYSVLENAPAHQSRRVPGDNRLPSINPDDIPSAVSTYLSVATGLVDLFDNRRLVEDLMLWANLDQKPDDATTVVNLLVLAIGRQMDNEELAQDYFEYARDKAYANLSGNLSVTSIQIFTLITLYMLCSCQINGAFLFFGIASLLTAALEYLEKRELAERQRRTENSSQLFGLIPSEAGTDSTSPAVTGDPSHPVASPASNSRPRDSLDRSFLQHNGLQGVGSPPFGDLDSAFLGLSESMLQTPDPSYWGGPTGMEGDSGSALNLFALLDAGGGIDLTHHL